MRRTSRTGYGEKLYINNSGLCVNGTRIIPTKTPIRQNCYGNKNIKIERENTTEEVEEISRKKSVDRTKLRDFLRPNVTNYKNSAVCNKQLRQIYETVKVDDFERILKNFYISDEYRKREKFKEDKVLSELNATEIYEEFFGQYYRYLNEVLLAAPEEEDTQI